MEKVEKLQAGVTSVVAVALSQYVNEQGGTLRDDARLLTPDEAASPQGGLPALLFMIEEIARDHALSFARLRYRHADDAYLGIELAGIESEYDTDAAPLFIVSDLLRKEILPSVGRDFDMSQLFENFGHWCSEHPELLEPPLSAPGHAPRP